ncbi:MAG: PAS domain S-box protein [Candidatus Obscuribacterales bacterium]|nr:PAS domain S-box protein [Candidatus Obscuribacterales bacterium]
MKERQAKSGPKLFHKGLILVFTPLLIEIFLVAALGIVLLQMDRESLKESRHRKCAALGAKLVIIADKAAIDVISWFHSPTQERIAAYDSDIKLLRIEEKKLLSIPAADSLAGESAKDLTAELDDLLNLLDQIAELAKQRRLLDMTAIIPQIDMEFRSKKNSHIDRMNSFTLAQDKIAARSVQTQRQLREEQRIILIVGMLANIAIALVLFCYFKKSIYERLQMLRTNTNLLAEGQRPKTPLSGADEIAFLDQAFHEMDKSLKEASERERELFSSASDVICVLNERNEFKKVNPASIKHWGFAPDELIDFSIEQILASSEASESVAKLNAARRSEAAAEFELKLERKDGRQIETLWSSYWSQEEALLYCVVHDISEQKQLERMKQAYLSIVGSDLKLPLSIIADRAALLSGSLKSALSPKALQRMELVKTNLARLLALVNDFLEMAALQSGKLELDKRECELEAILKQSLHDLEGLAEKKKIQFQIESGVEKGFFDQNRICQVLVNILANAVKFSPEQGVVKIKTQKADDYLLVEISDQGRGVPDSHKEKIFEKFKQVEAADGKRNTGTGLGLPICKDIVEEHGGEISVKSEAGAGSTFCFKIPATEESFEKICREKKAAFEAAALEKKSSPVRKAPLIGMPEKKATGTSKRLMRFGLLLIGIPLLVEFAFIVAILSIIAETNESRLEELKQRQIAAEAYSILDSYFKMILLVSASSQYPIWLAYDKCCTRLQKSRANLAKLLRNDPVGLESFNKAERFNRRVDPYIEKARRVLYLKFDPKICSKLEMQKFELIAITSAVSRRLLFIINEAEQKESINPIKQKILREQQAIILVGGLAVNFILSFLMAAFFSKSVSGRLATLADNSSRFAAGIALNPALPGNDEIAELDRLFRLSAAKLDLARRKERAVFDNSQDLIASLDSQLAFLSVNPAAERLLGYSQNELSSISFFEVLEERAELEEILQDRELKSGKSLELEVKRKDGQSAYLLCSISRSAKQETLFLVAHDISSSKQLEELKRNFLAVVSHDLRNPLSSVLGFVTLIKVGAMGEVGEEVKLHLDEIIEQSEKLLDLINDLLDLEKLEAQGIQLIKSRELAGEVAYRAFETVAKRFSSYELLLDEKNQELELLVDKDRLSQAFCNIFTHIIKKLEQDKKEKKSRESNAKLMLEVHKEGENVSWKISAPLFYDKESSSGLFERLSLGENQHELKMRNGLALPLARMIVEAHRGSLELESDAEKGFSKFVIKIPQDAALRASAES